MQLQPLPPLLMTMSAHKLLCVACRDQHQESLPPMIKLTPASPLDEQVKVRCS